MKRILVPVDGSDGANRAAAFAAKLAPQLGCAITLIHVYDAPTASAMGLARQSAEEVERAKTEVSRGSFNQAESALAGAKADHYVAIGHPAQEIVSYAKSHEVDLIVMGSRGMSPVSGVLLGSVSDRVLHLAHCPVTIVR